jgi:hypothetical protein
MIISQRLCANKWDFHHFLGNWPNDQPFFRISKWRLNSFWFVSNKRLRKVFGSYILLLLLYDVNHCNNKHTQKTVGWRHTKIWKELMRLTKKKVFFFILSKQILIMFIMKLQKLIMQAITHFHLIYLAEI